jgi:Sugar (and other) transporter
MEQECECNTWFELWRTKGSRHRLLILITAGVFSPWSDNGLVSYYINTVLDSIGVADSTTQLLINGILQIVNFIVAVTVCFFVD